MNNNLKNKTERNTLFDSLKGIAILGIIITHSGAVNLPGLIGKIGAFGARGVQIFFIISAILTFKSLESFKKNNKSIKKWYFNKFLRIIPLYYISLLFYYFIVGFKPNYWSGYQPISKFSIYLNILLLNGLHPFSANVINVNWYIGTLTLFILIAPYLYKKINNLSKSILFLAISWLVAIFFQIVVGTLYSGENAYIWSSYWTHFSLINELPILAIGIILYYLIYKIQLVEKIKKNIKPQNLKILTISLTFCITLSLAEKIVLLASLETYSVLFGCLILIQIINPLTIIDNKIFSTIGKYSYGIYLFHNPIISILTSQYSKYISNSYVFVITIIVSTIILSILISYVLTNIIEKPLNKKLKKQ